MKELWEQAILPYNLPLTILLVLVVCFWLLSLLGAVGADSLDVDLDADLDVDVDADLDGGHANFGDIPAFFLRAVNATYIPVTIVLSVLVLTMWMGSILLNFYFNPGRSGLLAAAFVVAAFVIGVLATKAVTQPLVPLMRKLKNAEDAAPVIGNLGVVRSITLDSRFGQVEVQRPDGAPAILSARLGPDAEPVLRGTTVAIVSQDEGTGLYLARALPDAPSIDSEIRPV